MAAVIIANARGGVLSREGEGIGRWYFCCEIPWDRSNRLSDMLHLSEEQYGSYIKLAVDVPFRPRTKKAQGKLHAMIGRLAEILGLSLEDTKRLVKDEAVALGYGVREVVVGHKGDVLRRVIPKSEAEASGSEEHMLIMSVEKLAAMEGHDLEAEYREELRLKKEMEAAG